MGKIIRKLIILFLLFMLLFIWLAFVYFNEISLPYEFYPGESPIIPGLDGEVEPENQPMLSASAYPIIFVHGWMGKHLDYLEYQAKLEREGIALSRGLIERDSNESICPEKWPAGVSVSAEYYYYDNFNHPIEDYARELDNAIELVANCTGSGQVILVAHSMGGLVSRKYMVDYGDSRVKKLITLATPHYGFNEFTRTELILMIIRLFTGRDKEVDQMRPDSDFLMQLNQDDLGNRDKVVSIGTYNIANQSITFGLPVLRSELLSLKQQRFGESDMLVKLDSTKLEGAKHYQIEGCSHTELLDFRKSYPKGPISNPNTCPDAYELVKREILISH